MKDFSAENNRAGGLKMVAETDEIDIETNEDIQTQSSDNLVPLWLRIVTVVAGVLLCIGIILYTFINVNNSLACKYSTFPNLFGVSYYPVLDGSLHEGYEYGDLILINKKLDDVAGADRVGLTQWRSIDIWGVSDTRGIETYSRVGLVTKRIPHLGGLLEKSMGIFGITFYIAIPLIILLLLCERIYKIKKSVNLEIDEDDTAYEDEASSEDEATLKGISLEPILDEFYAETVTSDFVSAIKENDITISNTAEIEVEAPSEVVKEAPQEISQEKPRENPVAKPIVEDRETAILQEPDDISFGAVYEILDRIGAGVTFIEDNSNVELSVEEKRLLGMLDSIDPRAEFEKIIDADNRISIHNIDDIDKNQMEEITKTIIQNKNDRTDEVIGSIDRMTAFAVKGADEPKPYLTADEILAIRREQAARREQLQAKKHKNTYVRVEDASVSDENGEMAKLYYQSEISDYKE